MTPLQPLSRACILVVVWTLAIAGANARADELADAVKLQSEGRSDAALEKVSAGLTTKPKDARLRFLKGVLLADLKRNDDALVEFQRLTEDFPELAEPYNNIAALHAAAGRYERSREALEAAIRMNPSYAIAHENLGDVYAMLASQSYAKAVQLAPANRSAPPKLALLRELLRTPVAEAKP